VHKLKLPLITCLLRQYLAFHFASLNSCPVRYKIIYQGEQSTIFNSWLQNLTQILRSCPMMPASGPIYHKDLLSLSTLCRPSFCRFCSVSNPFTSRTSLFRQPRHRAKRSKLHSPRQAKSKLAACCFLSKQHGLSLVECNKTLPLLP